MQYIDFIKFISIQITLVKFEMDNKSDYKTDSWCKKWGNTLSEFIKFMYPLFTASAQMIWLRAIVVWSVVSLRWQSIYEVGCHSGGNYLWGSASFKKQLRTAQMHNKLRKWRPLLCNWSLFQRQGLTYKLPVGSYSMVRPYYRELIYSEMC